MRDTKHLEKHASKLVEKIKEKSLFKNLRKVVNAGAHGTFNYILKKGKNKNKVAK